MKLTTKRLILRELTMEDKESFIKNINNLKVSRYMALVPYPYTPKDFKWWFNERKVKRKKKPRTEYDFNIQLKKETGIIGAIGFDSINRFNGTATIGYWLGEDYWRQGIMSEALEKVLDFAFNKVKLRRINISASPKNKASNALIRKIGFKHEGMTRKRLRVKSTGKIHDSNIYGMLKSEWKKK